MYKIKSLELWKDKEGKKVYKFPFKTEKCILIEAKKRTILGEHYHKGTVETKNPEVNVVVKGKAKYTLKDVRTDEQTEVIVEAPSIIEIYPFAYHTIEALEDLSFLEPFDEEAIKKDRFD